MYSEKPSSSSHCVVIWCIWRERHKRVGFFSVSGIVGGVAPAMSDPARVTVGAISPDADLIGQDGGSDMSSWRILLAAAEYPTRLAQAHNPWVG